MSRGPPVRIPKPRSASASWEVEQESVDEPEAGRRRHLGQLPEVGLAEDEAITEGGLQARGDPGNRRRIGVEAEQPAVGRRRREDSLGMPAAAQRRVDLEAARRGRQHRQDLVEHDRQMAGRRLASGSLAGSGGIRDARGAGGGLQIPSPLRCSAIASGASIAWR
jgi:hypothetical protein